MILRLIGAILLITSIITGAALTGMTVLGMEVNLDYPGWGWSQGISSIDGKIAVALEYHGWPLQGPATGNLDVYKYRVVYSFNLTQPQGQANAPATQIVSVTQVSPAGNTVVTVITSLPAAQLPLGPAGGVTGYNIEKCMLYIVTERELQPLLNNPSLYQRLQSGVSWLNEPAQFESYLKLLESITPHIYNVQATGPACQIEAATDSRPVYILVIHVVDPNRLRIEHRVTHATSTGLITATVTFTGEDIVRYLEGPTPENSEKNVTINGSTKLTVSIFDAIDRIQSIISPGYGSVIEVKARLEVDLMSMWRLASIIALGIVLMRIDRGEQGDLLPGPFRRLARRLGAGRG